MIREDYIERSIRQLRDFFARLLGKTGGEEDHGLLDARLEDLYRQQLGLTRQLLASLDAPSQLRVLGDRATVAIELWRGEQELLAAAGRADEAAKVARRLAQLEELMSD